MASTIVTKNSSTASAVPVSGDLTQGELAVNVTDKRLFTKNSGGTVVELGTNPASLALPNGTTNGVAYLNGSKVVTTGSALTFDGTNLGVGTTSPAYKLDVQTAAGRFQVRDLGGSSLKLINSTTGGNIGIDSAGGITLIYANGTETARFDASGNLGIGTSSPAYPLDVVAPSGSIGISLRGRSADDIATFGFYTNNGATNTAQIQMRPNDNEFRFAALGARSQTWYTNGSERMRLDSSGNLGIGTTSPVGNFNVNTTGNTQVTISAGSTGLSRLVFQGQVSNNRGFIDYDNTSSVRAMIFRTDETERARIDSSGNTIIGATSTGSYLTRLTLSYDSGTTKWSVGPWSTATGSFVIAANASQGVYLPSTTSTSWSSASDERLKENLVPIENGLEKVCSLRAVTGNFISDESKQRKSFLIAQDVQTVLPEAISSTPDGQYLGVSYTDTIPLLVAAIKEQQAIIEQLKADVAALKGN